MPIQKRFLFRSPSANACINVETDPIKIFILEKLVKDDFVRRERKQMILTEDGTKLIIVLSDMVKSPKLITDGEKARIVEKMLRMESMGLTAPENEA